MKILIIIGFSLLKFSSTVLCIDQETGERLYVDVEQSTDQSDLNEEDQSTKVDQDTGES